MASDRQDLGCNGRHTIFSRSKIFITDSEIEWSRELDWALRQQTQGSNGGADAERDQRSDDRGFHSESPLYLPVFSDHGLDTRVSAIAQESPPPASEARRIDCFWAISSYLGLITRLIDNVAQAANAKGLGRNWASFELLQIGGGRQSDVD